jgi:hypothetical protein
MVRFFALPLALLISVIAAPAYADGLRGFWPHRDGKGLSLTLSVIPMNGQIVLRQPLPEQ